MIILTKSNITKQKICWFNNGVYKQTANALGMSEYLSAYRTKPTGIISNFIRKFRPRDDNNNLGYARRS